MGSVRIFYNLDVRTCCVRPGSHTLIQPIEFAKTDITPNTLFLRFLSREIRALTNQSDSLLLLCENRFEVSGNQ